MDPQTLLGQNLLLAQNWGLVMLRGVVAIVLALIAFFLPGATIASLVLLFFAYMIVDGVFAIGSGIRAARKNERWGWLIWEGLIRIAIGVVTFMWPSITVLAFVWMVAAWAALSGVMMLVAASRLGKKRGRPWLILAGLVSLVWAGLLIASPVAGAVVMTWWLGAYALLFGFAMVALAWRLRAERHQDLQRGHGQNQAPEPGQEAYGTHR
ncbi:MAG: HdeD family acid-resistance protein [Burkholderiaceae bacterium]